MIPSIKLTMDNLHPIRQKTFNSHFLIARSEIWNWENTQKMLFLLSFRNFKVLELLLLTNCLFILFNQRLSRSYCFFSWISTKILLCFRSRNQNLYCPLDGTGEFIWNIVFHPCRILRFLFFLRLFQSMFWASTGAQNCEIFLSIFFMRIKIFRWFQKLINLSSLLAFGIALI